MEGSGIEIQRDDITFKGVDGVYLLKSDEEFKRLRGKNPPVEFSVGVHNYKGFYENIGNAKYFEKISSRIYKRKNEGVNDKFNSKTIRIGTFNVGEIDSLNMIGKIMQNMDILLVQELSEKDYEELEGNQKRVIKIGHTGEYKFAISERQVSHRFSIKTGHGTDEGSFLAIFFDTNAFGWITHSFVPSYTQETYTATGEQVQAGVRTTNFEYLKHADTGKTIAVMSVHLPVPKGAGKDRAELIMDSINGDVEEVLKKGADYIFVGGDFNQKYNDMYRVFNRTNFFFDEEEREETHSSYSGDFDERLDYILWVNNSGLDKLSVDYGDPNIKELATNINDLKGEIRRADQETKFTIDEMEKIEQLKREHDAKISESEKNIIKQFKLGHTHNAQQRTTNLEKQKENNELAMKQLKYKLIADRKYLPSQKIPYDHLLVSYTFRLT